MLCLTRKTTEAIKIGDDIIIWIKDIEQGVVRIAIDAPRSLEIDRLDKNGKTQTDYRKKTRGHFG